jgi:hypothetical protein
MSEPLCLPSRPRYASKALGLGPRTRGTLAHRLGKNQSHIQLNEWQCAHIKPTALNSRPGKVIRSIEIPSWRFSTLPVNSLNSSQFTIIPIRTQASKQGDSQEATL